MPEWKHKQIGTAGIYHYNHGTDTMFLTFENKLQKDNVSFGLVTGLCNTSSNNPAALVDLKQSYKYGGIFNENIRIRNTFSDGTNTTQIRFSPATVTIPVCKNTSVYLNPHLVGKYNYNTREWTQGIGAFVGTEHDFGNSSIALEVQRYNIQDFNKNKGNWGINVIYSKTF